MQVCLCMTREELLNRVKTEVPETSGVYIMKDAADEVIYVGKAKVLRRRMKSYFDVSEIAPPNWICRFNQCNQFRYPHSGHIRTK